MQLENIIYCGDNLIWLKKFPDKCIDLIYLDPPFFSNKQYEVIFNDGEEIRSFEDRWQGGINHYIEWMKERVFELHRILKDTGSFYLHCDSHASHYLKITCDEIFRYSNFKNDIIWKRTHAHNDPRRFGRNTDHILFYTKSKNYIFNPIYIAYDEKYIENFFKNEDSKGRYQSVVLTGPKVSEGESDIEWRGYKPSQSGRSWSVPKRIVNSLVGKENAEKMGISERLDLLYENGYIVISSNGIPRFKQYLNDMEGAVAQEVWDDIPPISSQSNERFGYPTQKPETLMERIIKASSNKDDLILDPFCGCGTTIAVAQKLQRKWIGIDVSPAACKLMKNRVEKNSARGVKIIGLPVNIVDLKELPPFEFQNWCIGALGGTVNFKKVGDMGIDGFTFFNRYPIQVKQSENIGRNVVDNFETALQRVKKDKGFIIALSFGKGAYEEVARIKKEGLFIDLLTVDKLLGFSEEKVSDKMFEFY
ncbi:MAG: restriction endonuclease [Actinobacteria bacterium]|nr:restriction endonuclease [Actinomycetota bacterium]